MVHSIFIRATYEIRGKSQKADETSRPAAAGNASFGLSRTASRIFRLAGLRGVRAATARFRRPPAMILGPRHASLIAASRNLERFALRRERLVEYHILSVRLRIERPSNADCSAGPLSSESGQRAFERLEKSQISADTHKWGAFPIYI